MKYKNLQLFAENRVGLITKHGNMSFYISIFTQDGLTGHMKNPLAGVYEYFIGFQGQPIERTDRFTIYVSETI